MIGISCISCGGRVDPEDTDAQSGIQSPGETLDPNSEEALLMPDQEPLDFDFKILANQQWYNFWHYGYDAEANGELPGGCELRDVEVPARTSTRLTGCRPDVVAAALGPGLPDAVAGLLEGGEG